ncbi:RagB/SusD family nutrient uptake outer membrane protein [Dokdonia sp. Dokd-P16]|uniref:RagB/SusD family nutrient uptake outer membrane protein n=1 Tax=Dokdonia sp. Dokd-P16 TaxID=2173169 RepID=UPI000D5491F6|nr:RagB/SusD family nutrient uptake outer membrane protein [Dokdonia sp. Dokd-P16]AWH73111.1 RagB/SusD family nutrient uptake outer membrane protein [Dokdonia sp. Dokd-P16]
MKTIKTLITIFIMTLGLTSCDDELEIAPFTQGDADTFYNSVNNFEIALNGMYSSFFGYYSNGSGVQGLPDILSDNAIIARTGRGSNQVFSDFTYGANNGGYITNVFNGAYTTIRRANLMISQIDNIDGEAERDNILGQALAGRAFAHLDLVRTYGKIPTQSADANASLGITYIKEPIDALSQLSRETVASNYENIITDLTDALALIDETTLANGDKTEGVFNKNSVRGMLSRVYLYTGDYDAVIDIVDEITAPLATRTEIPGVYTDSNDAGLLVEFAVNTASESNFNNVGVIYSQTISGSTVSEFAVDFGLFNSLQFSDVRTNIITFAAENEGNNYNAINKFIGETDQVNGRVDIKALRVAEAILNKAEAQFELGLEGDALITLDLLRAQRFSPFTIGTETGQDLEDAIQLNRRIELAFEGHRFYDLKRRGEAIVRGTFGDLANGTGTPNTTQTLEAGNFRFQLPIPQAEINVNPNYTQNEGY